MIEPGEENERGGRGERSKRVEIYDVEAAPPPAPPLPGETVVRNTPDELVDVIAADLMAEALKAVRRFGDFHLALSGGSTPQPLYERLMYCPTYRGLPWNATHLWIVDERCVPFDSEYSNFRMIRETIVEHSDIPPGQVHPINAMSPHADLEYEKEIRETLCWRPKGEGRLDFALLGMGSDGHTASLFPRSEALEETERLVVLNDAPGTPVPKRVTMTFPMLNATRCAAVLVVGASKAATIQRLVSGRDPVEDMPIKGIRPEQGVLRWYLDAAACRAG